nr:hypothetical protein 10.9 kDa [uncultured bacterium]
MNTQTTPKKRSKVKLAVLILLSLGGWAAAIGTGMTLGAAKNQAVEDQRQVQLWRAKAAKAYTELLKAKSGTPGQITVPAGSLVDCAANGTGQLECSGLILPPADY